MGIRWKNTADRWGVIGRWMHWLTALLIFATLLMGWIAVRLPVSPEKIDAFVWHKSLGIVTLWVVMLRLGWLLFNRPPRAVADLSEQHWRGAKFAHGALYLGLLLVPLSGWLLNSAANIPLIAFSVWPAIPNWPVPAQWQDALSLLHVYGVYSFLALIGVHVFFALWHHVHQSQLLIRLLPERRTSRFGLAWLPVGMFAIVAVVYWQALMVNSPIPRGDSVNHPMDSPSVLAPALHVPAQAALLPVWTSVPKHSQLTFEATYEGSPFSGAFKVFSADIAFDENQLDQSYLNATIHTQSVTTFNQDWDSSLPEDDWFAVELFPKAYFTAKGFQPIDQQFVTNGELTLKGIKKNVTFSFEWQSTSTDKKRLIGKATLNRTDFNIGSGYWAEDDSIGFTVNIAVNLELQPAMQ